MTEMILEMPTQVRTGADASNAADSVGRMTEELAHVRSASDWPAKIPAKDQKLAEETLRASPKVVERTALLGILMAELEAVDLPDVAVLLDVKPERLQKLLQGYESIPQNKVARWQELAEALYNLHCVLKVSATGRWLHTPIRALGGKTPIEAIAKGRHSKVVEVTLNYRVPDFS